MTIEVVEALETAAKGALGIAVLGQVVRLIRSFWAVVPTRPQPGSVNNWEMTATFQAGLPSGQAVTYLHSAVPSHSPPTDSKPAA